MSPADREARRDIDHIRLLHSSQGHSSHGACLGGVLTASDLGAGERVRTADLPTALSSRSAKWRSGPGKPPVRVWFTHLTCCPATSHRGAGCDCIIHVE